MKKCILLGFVFLSAIGARAEEEINYPTSITYGNIVYALTPDSIHTDGYSIHITNTSVNAEDAYSKCRISLTTIANGTRTNYYRFNAMATGIDGGTNVIYSLELNDFETIEQLPNETGHTTGTIKLGDGAYAATMELAKAKDPNIYSFDEISAVNKYYWPAEMVWDPEEEEFILSKGSSSDSLDLKAAFPKYREAYYYLKTLSGERKNYYIIENVVHSETYTKSTTNQYVCQVCEIHPNFRVPSTVTNITLGSKIWRIPDSSIFSDATNLALITVSGTGSDFQFKKGILYKMEASMEKEIVTATTTLTDQTLPESIDSIYTDAFKNAPEGVVITSMNYSLKLNGNDNFKVVFLIPDETATVVQSANGGYIVKGNLTQYHIDNLRIEGTYMDFTQVNLLTDIYFDNGDKNHNVYNPNTLLYFKENPGKKVSGRRNVIIGERCTNCVITDNGSEKFFCNKAFLADSLEYTRSFDCKWKTTTLPFSLDDNEIDDYLIVGKLIGYDENTNTFNFQYSNSISANQPYIVKTKSEFGTIDYRYVRNAYVEVTDPHDVSVSNAFFVPVYESEKLWSSRSEFENYYGIQNIYDNETKQWKNYMQIFDGVTVNPFRAYLIGPKITSEAAKYRLVDAMGQLLEEGEFPITTSGIEDVKESETSEAIYNLNGQRINNAHRGLNIVNGKVVLNK